MRRAILDPVLDLWCNIDWGDVPTWLAFIGAALAVFYTRRTLLIEQARDEERREDQRREQAAKFAAWCTDRARRDELQWHGGLILRNASEVPVYDVSVTFHLRGTERRGERYTRGVVPPGEHYAFDVDSTGMFTLISENAYGVQTFMEDWDEYLPEVTFTDAAGHVWSRNVRGELSRMPRLAP